MNKHDMVVQISSKLNLSKKQVEETINMLFDTVTQGLLSEGKVQVFGFGNFEITERSARMGINPKTKEKIKIAAKKSVKFKAAKALKDTVK